MMQELIDKYEVLDVKYDGKWATQSFMSILGEMEKNV